jgi:hypothetical protein
MWSIGATVDDDSRKDIDACMRELDAQFPHKDSVYEYYVDPKKKGWTHWEEKLNASWKVPNEPFFKILVPTVDTTRYSYLLAGMIKAERHVLLTGDVGVGKTSIVFSTLQNLDDSFVFSNLNFSAQTSSTKVSDGFESRVEKRTKDTFAPPGGKKLVMFIDDFNSKEGGGEKEQGGNSALYLLSALSALCSVVCFPSSPLLPAICYLLYATCSLLCSALLPQHVRRLRAPRRVVAASALLPLLCTTPCSLPLCSALLMVSASLACGAVPEKEIFNAQPPLEILRQWMQYEVRGPAIDLGSLAPAELAPPLTLLF